MSNQVFDIKSWRDSLKTKYNIADEDFAPFANGQVTSTSEFSRYQAEHKTAMAQVEAERQRVQSTYAQLQQYETFVQQLEQRYGPREQWTPELLAHVGAQNPSGSGTVDTSALTAELANLKREFQSTISTMQQTFAQQLEQTGQGAAAFSRFYLQAHRHWEKEYGTDFPEDDFRKFYEDNGYTDPRVALQLFEVPHASKKREAEWEKKIADAEARGRQSALSQAGIPEVGSAAGGWLGGAAFPAVGSGGIVDLAKAATDELPPDQAAQAFSQRMNAVRNGQSPASAVASTSASSAAGAGTK